MCYKILVLTPNYFNFFPLSLKINEGTHKLELCIHVSFPFFIFYFFIEMDRAIIMGFQTFENGKSNMNIKSIYLMIST
jgi:hypothetical protein